MQDMACDTFLKIVQRCTRRFVTLQPYEQSPFIEEVLFQEDVLADLTRVPKFQGVMSDLEPQQRHRFYEALALMIQAVPDDAKVPRLIGKLMSPPNAAWDQILTAAQSNRDLLRDQDVIRKLNDILLSSVAACTSLGAKFLPQMEQVYTNMLGLYHAYSELIQQTIAEAVSKGIPADHAARYSVVRQMRSFKKTALRLVETFADKCDPVDRGVLLPLVSPLIGPVLQDYCACPYEETREPEVLSCLGALIDRLGELFQPFVSAVLQNTFEVTLGMITRNMEEYPEHRLKFFGMLRAITSTCFNVLFEMSPQQASSRAPSMLLLLLLPHRNLDLPSISPPPGPTTGGGATEGRRLNPWPGPGTRPTGAPKFPTPGALNRPAT